MLRSLNLTNVRTITKYKETGIKFKRYYFFSNKLTDIELTELKKNNLKIKIKIVNKKSILIWAYKNDVIINNSPFLSIIKAGK